VAEPVLEVKGLSFRYIQHHDQQGDSEAISNVSLRILRGEWVALLGRNGSGKSTLAKLLAGILSPHGGEILLHGEPLDMDHSRRSDLPIGIITHHPDDHMIGTTVQDDIAFGLENRNIPYDEMKHRVEEVLERFKLSPYRHHDPSRLSSGLKQLAAIAGVLALKPSLIILDEALTMLDTRSKLEMIDTLRQLQVSEAITILSITHDMNEAAAADRLFIMESGTITASGTPDAIFKLYQELEPPLGESLRRCLLHKGRKVPSKYMTEEEVVDWLCTSPSKTLRQITS